MKYGNLTTETTLKATDSDPRLQPLLLGKRRKNSPGSSESSSDLGIGEPFRLTRRNRV